MPFTLNIPLTDTFYDEVEDAFIDKPITAQRFIFDLVKTMCKDAKAGKLNRSCSVNVIENGQIKQEFLKLNDVNLDDYTLESDPNWLPKDLDKVNARNWQHKVTDKTMEYVKMYCQMVGLRFEKYNESGKKEGQERIDKLKKELETAPDILPSPPDPSGARATKAMLLEQVVVETKRMEEGLKKAEETVPKNIEECIYSQIYPKLHQEVMNNLEKEFDHEFNEMYPAQKPSEKNTVQMPGTRPGERPR